MHVQLVALPFPIFLLWIRCVYAISVFSESQAAAPLSVQTFQDHTLLLLQILNLPIGRTEKTTTRLLLTLSLDLTGLSL